MNRNRHYVIVKSTKGIEHLAPLASKHPHVPDTPNRSRRILVVDDEPSVRMACQLILKHLGHDAVAVSDAHEALQLLESESFDLVITDQSMPGMKGIELIAEIRHRIPNQRIIMVTAHLEDLQASTHQRGGADGFLNKPFKINELQAIIAKVLAVA